MEQLNFVELGYKLGMVFVPFLFALCFHEMSHAVVAKMRGDNTGEREGRLSMNPMVHADPIGTWTLPVLAILLGSSFFFGWAKPVPVDTRNLKNPRMDMFWIALAGPMSNVFLAIVGTFAMAVIVAYGSDLESARMIRQLLSSFILLNLFLAVFNLIPIHPLDGGKVVEPFLPIRWNMWLEQNQGTLSMFLLVILLLGGPILSTPVTFLAQNLLNFAGALALWLT